MSRYELLVVLPGTLDENQAKNRLDEVADLVRAHGQEVELHPLGKNRLAYPIKQIRYGYFHTVLFSAEPAAVRALEQKLALARDLLRTMITHFNTTLTAAQRIVYSTDTLGLTTMVERPAPAVVPVPITPSAPKEVVASPVARELDATSIEEISKKLDDLMRGDVIPGV